MIVSYTYSTAICYYSLRNAYVNTYVAQRYSLSSIKIAIVTTVANIA